jgi:hypothetical protein
MSSLPFPHRSVHPKLSLVFELYENTIAYLFVHVANHQNLRVCLGKELLDVLLNFAGSDSYIM